MTLTPYLLALLGIGLGSSTVAPSFSDDDYVVAVYEHKPVGTPVRDTPVELMHKNLMEYEKALVNAVSQNVQLIVFPEYGLYASGSYSSRDRLLPYLQIIPSAWSPCQTSSCESEIFLRLSCLAKTYSLTIVANIGTVWWCDQHTPDNCPSDGRFQYNTNVVFNSTGNLVATYHKYNLFGERFFDQPPLTQTTFLTNYGKIGVAVCFDLLQKSPLVDMVQSAQTRAVVLPSLWFNRIPFLAMYEYAEAWAIRMNTFLLVPNVHSPLTAHVGSGIFGPRGTLNYSYVTASDSPAQLVTARLPRSAPQKEPNLAGISPTENSSPKKLSKEPGPATFFAKTNGDRFKYIELKPGDNMYATTCQDNLCCSSNYTLAAGSLSTGFFALGSFSGIHRENYTLCNEVCAVVRCIDQSHCGDGISQGVSGLKNVILTGNFSTFTYTFPVVLMDDARLDTDRTWTYDSSSNTLANSLELGKILTFALYGRCFGNDPV